MYKYIFHIDVNSAYLSWEQAYRDCYSHQSDLLNIPSCIGGNQKKRKGIVLAKSIPAKKYGIKTGESLFSALEKCPHLKIIPPNYHLYKKSSQAMVDLLFTYSDAIERYSIDEVFFGYNHSSRSPLDFAKEISSRIQKELGFTVNIGISENKIFAKIASDFSKPNKIHTLYLSEMKEKLWPLPVQNLFMVGRQTAKKLHARGIHTIGDFANLSEEYVYNWLKKPGVTLWIYANGYAKNTIKMTEDPIKSIGNSTTTPHNIENRKDCHRYLLAISEMVSKRLRENHLTTKCISVSFKNSSFEGTSIERSLLYDTNTTQTIYQFATKLFDQYWNKKPLRKFSLRASKLKNDRCQQLSFFDLHSKNQRLDEEIDRLREIYGLNSIFRSTFLHSGIQPIIGGVIADEDYTMMKSTL